MILVEDSFYTWIKKHGLIPKKYECPKCTKEFFTDKPFLTRYFVGLKSENHPCGPSFIKIVVKPRTAQKKIELHEALTSFY